MSRFKKDISVALKYKQDEDVAPIIIASGYGNVAKNIIDIAEQKGIPVFRDDSAASLLCMLDIGESIPAELYEVVAHIYAQIMGISQKIKDDKKSNSNDNRLKRLGLD